MTFDAQKHRSLIIIIIILKLSSLLQSGNQKVGLEISGSNEKLEAIVESQRKQLSSLQAKIDKQANELKLKVDKVAVRRSSASFKWELSNVSKFFEVDDSLEFSNRFWCKGMQWSLYVKNNRKEDGSQHLGFFVRCHNDDPQPWSCQTNGKLILFGSSKNQNKFWWIDHIFKNSQACGASYLIGYPQMKNGYIKNDKIVLGVELNAGPVVRNYA